MKTKKRATPLSPDERRQSIVDAVTRIILDEGTVPTTAEIAAAVGIAEGTIYSVFPDKHSIFRAVIERSVDQGAAIAALSQVYSGAPLERQLAEAVRIMQERLDRTVRLVTTIRAVSADRHDPGEANHRQNFHAADSGITKAIVALFDDSEIPLAMPAERLAMMVRSLVFASAHPLFGPKERLTVDEIVAVTLAAAGAREQVS